MFNFDLIKPVANYLTQHSPCSEFDLIQHLQAIGCLPKQCLSQPLALFRSHFLVFNALYRLRQQLQHEHHLSLEIHALSIKIVPLTATTPLDRTPQAFDKLARFYLDLSQANQTQETDINILLDQFWQRYLHNNSHEKQMALAQLELQEPVNLAQIKRQYRRLTMRHHPDRGGQANDLIAIQQAMQCLKQYY